MFVLDTDVCVDIQRGYAPTIEAVREMEREGPLAVTSVTVHELVQGAHTSPDPERAVASVDRLLSAFDILEFNGAAGWIAGRLSAKLLKAGTPIGDLDTIIASCALAHNRRLVTRNTKHFRRVAGLHLNALD